MQDAQKEYAVTRHISLDEFIKNVDLFPLPRMRVDQLVSALILRELYYTGGNRTHAARNLGISLRCLRYKLNRLREEGYVIPGDPAEQK